MTTVQDRPTVVPSPAPAPAPTPAAVAPEITPSATEPPKPKLPKPRVRTVFDVTLDGPSLQAAVAVLRRVAPQKGALPIVCGNVLIKAEKGKLTARATDLSMEAVIPLKGKVEVEGELVAPLRDFLERAPLGPVRLVSRDTATKVQKYDRFDAATGKSVYTLADVHAFTAVMSFGSVEVERAGHSPKDFPPPAKAEGWVRQAELPRGLLELAKRRVAVCALAENRARPILASVLFTVEKGETHVVAADGWRMALLSLPKLRGMTRPFRIEWSALSRLPSETYRVSLLAPQAPPAPPAGAPAPATPPGPLLPDNMVRLASTETPGLTFTLQADQGVYPNYKQLLPAQKGVKARPVFKARAFLDVLKGMPVPEATLRVQFPRKGLLEASIVQEGTTARATLEVGGATNAKAKVAVNSKHLKEAFRDMVGDVAWSIWEQSTAFVWEDLLVPYPKARLRIVCMPMLKAW